MIATERGYHECARLIGEYPNTNNTASPIHRPVSSSTSNTATPSTSAGLPSPSPAPASRPPQMQAVDTAAVMENLGRINTQQVNLQRLLL